MYIAEFHICDYSMIVLGTNIWSMHTGSFLRPACFILNIVSTFSLILHTNILQNNCSGTDTRFMPRHLSQLVRSPCFGEFRHLFPVPAVATFSSCHCLLNKAKKHLAYICASVLSTSAVTLSSSDSLLLLVWCRASFLLTKFLHPTALKKIDILLVDDISYGLSLFTIAWKCLPAFLMTHLFW